MLQDHYFADANGNPLPEGTAIEFPAFYHHQSLIGYDWTNQQILLEKSKRCGRPTITSTEEYRGIPFVISRFPNSHQHGSSIVQHAFAEIQAGAPWTYGDNCQDFVTRAYEGKNGSKTRNFVFGAIAVLACIGLASASSQ